VVVDELAGKEVVGAGAVVLVDGEVVVVELLDVEDELVDEGCVVVDATVVVGAPPSSTQNVMWLMSCSVPPAPAKASVGGSYKCRRELPLPLFTNTASTPTVDVQWNDVPSNSEIVIPNGVG
jgi:hypothetical protein